MSDSQPVSVLLVEDRRAQRELLCAALTTSGYRVTAVTSGLEAIDPHRRGGHDVLLVAAVLPDISGVEVLARARQADPDQCVIMEAAPGGGPSIVDAIRAGADGGLIVHPDAGSASADDLSAHLDITITRALERRQLLVANRELCGALSEASRLNELVALAGAAAHDMNQPLTVMSGITELLLMDADPGDPTCEDIETLRRATQRLCDIVGKLSAATTSRNKRVVAQEGVKELERAVEAR